LTSLFYIYICKIKNINLNNGYIYLFESISSYETEYKIGYTRNKITLKKRVKQLQTGNPKKIQIINFFPTQHGRKVETTLHNIYSQKRKEGEWFDLDLYDVKEFLNTCGKIEKNFDFLVQEENPFI